MIHTTTALTTLMKQREEDDLKKLHRVMIYIIRGLFDASYAILTSRVIQRV